MIKRINSTTGTFEDQVTDTLVLDTVPTVNSFNGVTSDGVARAVAGASGEVPQVTENDNGKILTAIYDAGGPAVEWQTMTVDQTYDATSTNAQSGVAVASAVGAVNAVPSSDIADAGKVLTVDAAGDAGWATPEVPTVDQTYDATSTNAQSGVAVASAVGSVNAVPASTSTDEGKVLTVDSNGTPTWSPASGGLPASTSADEGKVLTVDANGDPEWDTASGGLPASTSADEGKVLTVDSLGAPGWAVPPKDAFLVTYGTTTWAEISAAHNSGRPVFLYKRREGFNRGYIIPLVDIFESNVTASTNTYAKFITPLEQAESYNNHTYTIYKVDGINAWTTSYEYASHVPDVTSSNANRFLKSYYSGAYSYGFYWAAVKEVPASTSTDEGKVLTVDSNGTPVWNTLALGDIQSIVQVNALPANPDAHTLYLIPEA